MPRKRFWKKTTKSSLSGLHSVAREEGGRSTAELPSGDPDRRLIASEQQILREMFNEAAADVTEEDLEERASLLGGFAGGPPDQEAGL